MTWEVIPLTMSKTDGQEAGILDIQHSIVNNITIEFKIEGRLTTIPHKNSKDNHQGNERSFSNMQIFPHSTLEHSKNDSITNSA